MDLRQVDLNLLVAFDALMTERSVTRAAQRLSVGQSAMSSTLGRLRRLFGDPLLMRDGRQLVATPLAESLSLPIRELLTNIEGVLEHRRPFDPMTASRTFSVIANDYITMTFLRPLLAALPAEAPRVKLHVAPPGDDESERLRRHRADLLLIPREAFDDMAEFHTAPLFTDRYVVAVDRDNREVGDVITLDQFSSMPYVAMSPGYRKSISELQLDLLGIRRNVEITTGFAIVPFLLRGTQLIALVQERLGREYQQAAGIRLLRPPVDALKPIHVIMAWTDRTDNDPAHQWLRAKLTQLSAQM